jgi:hypothetical protein
LGYWTEDAALLDGVKEFLVRLIGTSEELESVPDAPDPDLAPVDFDEQAMVEAAAEWYQARRDEAELRGDESDDEEW